MKTAKEKKDIIKEDFYNTNNYFISLVKDSIRELKQEKNSYCFNKEQLQEIKKHFKNLEVEEKEGIYYMNLRGCKNVR